MDYFQQFILDFFAGLPEIDLMLPDFFREFLSDFVLLINCFLVFEDFSTLLAISVTYAFVNVAYAFSTFLGDIKR